MEQTWDHPKPDGKGQGQEIQEDGSLHPIWSLESILPQSLVDLLDNVKTPENDNIDNDDEDDKDDDKDLAFEYSLTEEDV